ncbi:ABC transporter ATP-binding protein [Nitrospirillum sp. BR 11163]|uniref:ABC transporter ATP-binding protein n=1 Tax=Nitrospirillum sp. BR 11163 TaxID=3104323 RepID=UPI002AFE2A2C|nr:ABC transporter ATP-binding protein [Nitrospirillum sp. BR 11163]MEA1674641.1 ABC transporter ATP-binding protein [Nitrospirillum sp. BR 11163]
MALLEVRGLKTWFDTARGTVRAVDGVDFHVDRGETLALVGESGSGKSVTAYSLLRLLAPPGRVVGGRALFDGVDLLTLDAARLRALRGGRIAMIFQEPMTALNPVMTVGAQVAEAVRLHSPVSRRQAWDRAVELLDRVRIPAAATRARSYPHELSGGMRQRVVIAMALACQPDLLIADEPTTALDVTTQAQILDLLRDLQRDMGMALILITHDLGVVAEVADRAAVFYAGRVVEQGPVAGLFDRPRHPYTRGLLASLRLENAVPGTRLPEIAGTVPSLLDLPPGCAFAPRCGQATDACRLATPVLATSMLDGGDGWQAACWAEVLSIPRAERIAELALS